MRFELLLRCCGISWCVDSWLGSLRRYMHSQFEQSPDNAFSIFLFRFSCIQRLVVVIVVVVLLLQPGSHSERQSNTALSGQRQIEHTMRCNVWHCKPRQRLHRITSQFHKFTIHSCAQTLLSRGNQFSTQRFELRLLCNQCRCHTVWQQFVIAIR